MPHRSFASLLAVLALAVAPASALGQSAGDDQYQDPLAAPAEPQQSEDQPQSAPATTQPADAAPATTAAPAAEPDPSAAAPAAEELPRTGLPAGLVGLAGAALAGAGVALRRRV